MDEVTTGLLKTVDTGGSTPGEDPKTEQAVIGSATGRTEVSVEALWITPAEFPG